MSYTYYNNISRVAALKRRLTQLEGKLRFAIRRGIKSLIVSAVLAIESLKEVIRQQTSWDKYVNRQQPMNAVADIDVAATHKKSEPIKPNLSKKTSDYHGYQIKIHYIADDYLVDLGERLHNNGKVYRSRKIAANVMSKLICDIDAGIVSIKGFTHCEIVEWFAE